MDASGKLVEIAAGAAQEQHELPQLRQVKVNHIAVNCHFPQIGTEIAGAVLLHFGINHLPFLLRNIEQQRYSTFPFCRHQRSGSFALPLLGGLGASAAGCACNFFRTEGLRRTSF